MFSLYATSGGSSGGNYGPVFIKKNEAIICAINVPNGNTNADHLGADTNSCTTVVEVTPEDSVRVTGSSDESAFILGGNSGFIGHMIQPYC